MIIASQAFQYAINFAFWFKSLQFKENRLLFYFSLKFSLNCAEHDRDKFFAFICILPTILCLFVRKWWDFGWFINAWDKTMWPVADAKIILYKSKNWNWMMRFIGLYKIINDYFVIANKPDESNVLIWWRWESTRETFTLNSVPINNV